MSRSHCDAFDGEDEITCAFSVLISYTSLEDNEAWQEGWATRPRGSSRETTGKIADVAEASRELVAALDQVARKEGSPMHEAADIAREQEGAPKPPVPAAALDVGDSLRGSELQLAPVLMSFSSAAALDKGKDPEGSPGVFIRQGAPVGTGRCAAIHKAEPVFDFAGAARRAQELQPERYLRPDIASALKTTGLVVRSAENPLIAVASVSAWRMVAATVPPHPHVAQPLAISDDGTALLMPRYVADLFTALWEPHTLPSSLASLFHPVVAATDLVEAVLHLHRHGVAHRDIKPENVLLTMTGEAVLADLDFCTRAKRLPIKMYAGTARYTPVSVSRRRAVYKAARDRGIGDANTAGRSSYDPFVNDRFALAVTVLDLLARDGPWTDATFDRLLPEDLVRPLRAVGARYGKQIQHALESLFKTLSADHTQELLRALWSVDM